jgi:hypothetical protein
VDHRRRAERHRARRREDARHSAWSLPRTGVCESQHADLRQEGPASDLRARAATTAASFRIRRHGKCGRRRVVAAPTASRPRPAAKSSTRPLPAIASRASTRSLAKRR